MVTPNADPRARSVWVQVCDELVSELRILLASTTDAPERPLRALAALLGIIAEAQSTRDAMEKRQAEREDYR